jgi:ribosome maturation factor RimP
VADELAAWAEPIVQGEGMELVDLEYRREGKGWVVRLFIDKPGGVTLEDCQEISRLFGAKLELEDRISHHYTLEVSSPGLDRVLKKEEDFRRFAGRAVDIRLERPLEGRRRFSGVLEGIEADRVILREDEGGVRAELPRSWIARARLKIEL